MLPICTLLGAMGLPCQGSVLTDIGTVGPNCTYATIQDAIDDLRNNNNDVVNIHISPNSVIHLAEPLDIEAQSLSGKPFVVNLIATTTPCGSVGDPNGAVEIRGSATEAVLRTKGVVVVSPGVSLIGWSETVGSGSVIVTDP